MATMKLKTIIHDNFKLLMPQPANKKLKVYYCKHCRKEYTMHTTRLASHLYSECGECPGVIKAVVKKYSKAIAQTRKSKKMNSYSPNSSMEFEVSDLANNSSCAENCSAKSSCSHPSPSGLSPSKTGSVKQNKSWRVMEYCDTMTKEENIKLQEKLASTIYSTGSTLSMSSNPTWVSFFKALRPSFTPPSRHAVSNNLLDRIYERTKQNVEEKVESAHCLGLQFDGWSNLRNEGIINVIITTPDPVFYETIETKEESHTAQYISDKIGEIIDRIGPSKVSGVCTDNASAMKAAWELLDQRYNNESIVFFGCLAHILNLLLKDIAAKGGFTDLIKQVVQIVKEVKKSQILTAELVKIQAKSPENIKTTLKLPVATRFGSTVHSLKSVMVNRQNLSELAISPQGISRLTRETRLNILGGHLETDFWGGIQEVLNVMEPIAAMLQRFETDVPSLSTVPEAFHQIRNHLDKALDESTLLTADECANIIQSFLKRRAMAVRDVHLAANTLDPVHKGLHLTDDDSLKAQGFIFNLAKKYNLDQSKIVQELTDYTLNKGIWGEDFVKQASVSTSAVDWWRATCRGTQLSVISSRILSLHSTSTATERSFSTFGWVHDKKRNRLSARRAAKLTYIAHNSRLLDKKSHSQMRRGGIIGLQEMKELSVGDLSDNSNEDGDEEPEIDSTDDDENDNS